MTGQVVHDAIFRLKAVLPLELLVQIGLDAGVMLDDVREERVARPDDEGVLLDEPEALEPGSGGEQGGRPVGSARRAGQQRLGAEQIAQAESVAG